MQRLIHSLVVCVTAGLVFSISSVFAQSAPLPEFYKPDASPQEDLRTFQEYFRSKFPGLSDEEFANGVYALDESMRANWEQIEEFPPYEPAIEQGRELWETAFGNGSTYADCFGQPAVVHEYPRWDAERGMVVTLPLAINDCRKQNGEEAYSYSDAEILAVHAYMAYESRGQPTQVEVPNDERALQAYEDGKAFYFARRGQLNLACYHCHFATSGQRLRANILGPARGQTSHWPAYRSKWGDMGSLHRRYSGCNSQVRAAPLDQQSEDYRNLEFFHTHMSNGVPLNGPGTRQ